MQPQRLASEARNGCGIGFPSAADQEWEAFDAAGGLASYGRMKLGEYHASMHALMRCAFSMSDSSSKPLSGFGHIRTRFEERMYVCCHYEKHVAVLQCEEPS